MLAGRDLALWAKIPKEQRFPTYHSLIYHLIDVGMVAREIWYTALASACRKALTEVLGLSEADAAAWIGFIASAHDIGKATPAFAYQADQKDRLEQAGFSFVGLRPEPKRHEVLSYVILKDFLCGIGFDGEAADALAAVVGSHHGVFQDSATIGAVGHGDRGAPNSAWCEAQVNHLQTLYRIFQLPGRPLPAIEIENAAGDMLILSGLVIMADWIASDERLFPYCTPGPDPVAYAAESSQRAKNAIETQGWTRWKPLTHAPRFGDLFKEKQTGKPLSPRPLQKAVIDLAAGTTEPSLYLIEAPMGEGKTEAALYVAAYHEAVLKQQGAFFALPTQATSNQMFERMMEFLRRAYPGRQVNLHLVHSHALLSDAYSDLKGLADSALKPTGIAADNQDHAEQMHALVYAAEWFTHRKRGLLSPYAVGTIDQALVSVLQTKHFMLRLYGLAHKTVIIDEVHAYDAYMTATLERLIEWLARLGCSVVLLSATLPRARRLALISAFHTGKGSPGLENLEERPYPRVTVTSGRPGGIRVRSFPAASRSHKPVRLKWVDARMPTEENPEFPLGAKLREALKHGGCAAVICNTVGRAQAVYQALKKYFNEEELDLFHARFPYGERARREQRTLRTFGTGKEVKRPHRLVLVATQVIEQSLDVDFDLIVTDIAPIDLLLQRLGRMHRHDHDRPSSLCTPELWVCSPVVMDGKPVFDFGTAAVYNEHILLRSYLTLQSKDELDLPKDIQPLIETVYAKLPCPNSLPPAVQEYWAISASKLVRDQIEERQKSADRVIPSPRCGDMVLDTWSMELDEDNPKVTRLMPETVNLVLLPHRNGVPLLDGTPIDVESRPTLAEAKKLMAHAVSITSPRAVRALKEKAIVPPGWTRSALLYRFRLVRLDEDGRAVEWPNLQVDAELGVVIR